ncbi:hypothetical protein [Epilithonimonas sp.]|uniref:hypothetical protein n=1 Tax=Epilithonimonas sp. TaxID=2894511 RepID=UPI00289B36A4|nr:hypothetical protein [Epilithonimonas sp.]
MEETKVLTKSYIVIYDNETRAIKLKMLDNGTTYVPDGLATAEFDTEQELEDYISENNLIEDNLLE